MDVWVRGLHEGLGGTRMVLRHAHFCRAGMHSQCTFHRDASNALYRHSTQDKAQIQRPLHRLRARG